MSATAGVQGNALNPDLAELQRQFAAIKAEAAELVNGLKESQFNWRPNAQSWSMAECLLHLNVAGDRHVRLIESAIEQGRAEGRFGQSVVKRGYMARRTLRNTEPPPRRKQKAVRRLTPAYGQPLTAVMPTFFHVQDQLIRLVEQANGLDLARIRAPLPGRYMKLNLGVTFEWIAAHERRHLWQARQVRNQAGFPAGSGGRGI
jgi:DinB superfamily